MIVGMMEGEYRIFLSNSGKEFRKKEGVKSAPFMKSKMEYLSNTNVMVHEKQEEEIGKKLEDIIV